MNFMNFKFFLLQHKKIYTLKLIVALSSSLLHHDICFQSFFPLFFKADLHSINVICPTNPLCWQMCCSGQNYRLEELISKLLTMKSITGISDSLYTSFISVIEFISLMGSVKTC